MTDGISDESRPQNDGDSSANGSKDHWNHVHQSSDPSGVSWFEPSPQTSLRFIEAAAPGPDSAVLDVGGGTATLAGCLLDRSYGCVGVLDVSRIAIELGQARLGELASAVEWFVGDVTEFHSTHPWDVWHDRALFHFLTAARDRLAYVDSVRRCLGPGGQVVVATFGPEAPTKCSGLEVCRYDADSLARCLGDGFELVDDEIVLHTTPAGASQQFLYCRFALI